MVAVLHVLKGADPALALATIDRQLAAGDQVTVVLLHGAAAPDAPAAVRVLRVPDELSWEGLLEQIFTADQVVTW